MHVHLCVAKAFGGFICQPGAQLLQVELLLLYVFVRRQLSCSSARMQRSAVLTLQSVDSCIFSTMLRIRCPLLCGEET